ncbi:MAG: tetratricopeptide repeat protein [Pseudomonadota bacterium]
MKKILFLILLVVSFNTISFAQTDKELFDTGVLLFKQDQYQKAIDQFSELIKRSPENADAYKNRGVSYMKLEKFDLAIQDFERAKSIFPELAGLYSNLGVARYYKKEYTKAIENYDFEIQMAPENAVAYFNRALCLAEINQNKKALDDLSKTLELNPDFYWAICYKADLLVLEGNDLEAIEFYTKAIQQDPNNTYAIEKIAELKKRIKEKQPPVAPDKQNKETVAYTLQVGAFQNQANAEKIKNQILKKGFDSRILVLTDKKDRTWYIVRSGSYISREDAKQAMAPLKQKMGIDSIVRPKGGW